MSADRPMSTEEMQRKLQQNIKMTAMAERLRFLNKVIDEVKKNFKGSSKEKIKLDHIQEEIVRANEETKGELGKADYARFGTIEQNYTFVLDQLLQVWNIEAKIPVVTETMRPNPDHARKLDNTQIAKFNDKPKDNMFARTIAFIADNEFKWAKQNINFVTKENIPDLTTLKIAAKGTKGPQVLLSQDTIDSVKKAGNPEQAAVKDLKAGAVEAKNETKETKVEVHGSAPKPEPQSDRRPPKFKGQR